MGIHDTDRAAEMVGGQLKDVRYLRTDLLNEIDTWEHGDLAEMIQLTVDDREYTIWVSEGGGDTIAVAGPPHEVATGELVTMNAADRPAWSALVGETIVGIRALTVPNVDPSVMLTTALEIDFGEHAITIAGYRPSQGTGVEWIDDLAVLEGPLPAHRELVGTVRDLTADLPAYCLEHFPGAREDQGLFPIFHSLPSLRFELSGIGGTWHAAEGRERTPTELRQAIEQARSRAVALFEACFDQSEKGWLYCRGWGHTLPVQRLVGLRFGRTVTQRRIKRELRDSVPARAREGISLRDVHHELDPGERDLAGRELEGWVRVEPRAAEFREILSSTAGAELGQRTSFHWSAWFVNEPRRLVFHMYDDRGLDVFAAHRDSLRPILDQYDSWILEYDRERVNAIFAD